MTSKLPAIPEPMTMKIRNVEKLKVIELKDTLKVRGCYIFIRPDNKYLLMGSIYAQEEMVVVNYDVVFTDDTC